LLSPSDLHHLNIRQYSIFITIGNQSHAIPETGFFMGRPASIIAIVPAHTVAIEEEPLDSNTSDTIVLCKEDLLKHSLQCTLRHTMTYFEQRVPRSG
jgi:hypothetical protein